MGRKNSKAFTLVELIIVVSIISLIALVAIAYFRGQLFKGNDARRKGELNRISVALEEYEQDHECYPLSYVVQCDPGTGLKPYLDKIPCDPATHTDYYYEYENDACPGWYRLYSVLENNNDASVIDEIGPGAAYNYYIGSSNAPALDEESEGTGGESGNGPPEGVTFYGCKAGQCVPISWDYARPGPECDPNFQNSSCYGQCGPQSTECINWQ